MTDVVIGCDIGTQSCKALAMDAVGAVLARASESYPVSHPHPGWAEQDPRDWERALRAVIGAVAKQVGAERVAAIGIAGQVDGIVPVDAKGEAMGPGIIWMDRRATAQAAELAARFDAGDVHARTGVNIDASHGGPKIAWLRAQERANGSPAADGYLMPVTHAVARLTGERLIDPSSASTTLLWDLHTRDWATDLMAATDAPAGCLGTVRPAWAVAGTLRPRVATETWAWARGPGRGGHRRRALGMPRGRRPGAGPGV